MFLILRHGPPTPNKWFMLLSMVPVAGLSKALGLSSSAVSFCSR